MERTRVSVFGMFGKCERTMDSLLLYRQGDDSQAQWNWIYCWCCCLWPSITSLFAPFLLGRQGRRSSQNANKLSDTIYNFEYCSSDIAHYDCLFNLAILIR